MKNINRNIILIYPPSWMGEFKSDKFTLGIPLSLLYLSGSIRDICSDVRIFDFNIKDNDDMALYNMIVGIRPGIIGISCLFSGNFPAVRTIAAGIKNEFPDIKIIIGGMHPTIYAREIMANCPFIDAVILGEGDYTFPSLLKLYYENINSGGGGGGGY
jgi:radical SAM superfamily enzyme YgiQ (UPF0313 family)